MQVTTFDKFTLHKVRACHRDYPINCQANVWTLLSSMPHAAPNVSCSPIQTNSHFVWYNTVYNNLSFSNIVSILKQRTYFFFFFFRNKWKSFRRLFFNIVSLSKTTNKRLLEDLDPESTSCILQLMLKGFEYKRKDKLSTKTHFASILPC